MASGTRSGRNLKHEDSSSSRKKNPYATTNGSRHKTINGDQKDTRRSTSSGSAATDSYTLRSSARKALNQIIPALTPRLRKSERLEKQNSLSPSDNANSEMKGKVGRVNDVRRSRRLDKFGASSPYTSKKTSNNSSSSDMNEKGKKMSIGKTSPIGRGVCSNESKIDLGSSQPAKKRKLLSARSYRALLRSEKKRGSSDDTRTPEKEYGASEQGNLDAKAVNSEEAWENGSPRNEHTARKGGDLNKQHFAEDGYKVVSGSSDGPTSDSKHKACTHSAGNFSDDENGPSLEHSRQSSLVGILVQNNCSDDAQQKIDDGNNTEVFCSVTKDLSYSELVESNSEGRSTVAEFVLESEHKAVGSKRTRENKSVGLKRTKIESNAITQPSSTNEIIIQDHCKLCSKVLRVGNDSQSHEVCLCNAAVGSDLCVTNEDRRKVEIADCTHGLEEHSSSAYVENSILMTQTETRPNACVVCKQPGKLLCCDGKGCKRSYHLSCLDPPLQDVPSGAWLCLLCMKKKLEVGVYTISVGIESVLDVKEVMENERHYFVKYKGLAHAHNLWVPESQLLVEAPVLVAKFNRRHQKEKAIRWKEEWTKPQRLLQKRKLIYFNLVDESLSTHADGASNCPYEWLVKWKGLGYEHATWELETAPFLCSAEAMVLKENYERRHKEAVKASDPSFAEQVFLTKNQKLLKLPDGISSGLDNDHLNAINRLREFWHKSHNALFIDDQERIVKSVLFILAIQSSCCRPFLVVSTTSSLSSWEAEFLQLAPSMNVVVYSGNRDVRKMIQNLEFYNTSGCVMFQVLLSHYDAITEDIESLDCIGWEAIILDECQNSRVSKHFEQLKNLSSDFRLLLLSGPLKDSMTEYRNLLSALDLEGKENCTGVLSIDSREMKEKLDSYLAYVRKSDSSKFVEFWVPVQLSNVQLEQYCATLISNSILLRSCLKNDLAGAFHDILIDTRKCCDHPYLADPLLQSSLINRQELGVILDIGIKASGKLQLLDKILQEIKNQGLRVVILFQSVGGAGRNSIGDILDDVIRHRFGADSYERVDSGLLMSRKLAALNMFNDRTKGRFAFLIENRACLPSIKLLSVDAVVIYDSDWNPLNDFRALQKITIESQFEQLKVFRLYTAFTVEEKVLAFSKQDMVLGSNIRNITPSICHSLLSWGAFDLFSKLNNFHQLDNYSKQLGVFDSDLDLNDVVLEILAQLPKKVGTDSEVDCSFLIRAPQSGASYSRNIVLIGEKEGISSTDKDHSAFWSNLLEGRNPQWRYISGSSERIRRKVQHVDALDSLAKVGSEEGRKKRRKVADNVVEEVSLQPCLEDKGKDTSVGNDATITVTAVSSCYHSQPSFVECDNVREKEVVKCESNPVSQSLAYSAGASNHEPVSSCDTSDQHKSCIAQQDEREKLRKMQRSLHFLLKPELSKLCKILRFPEDVKFMAETFLEYVMNNLNVIQDNETILQALKISLCWRAAAFLKHKVDHDKSLALAKKHLNFDCSYEQVKRVYKKLHDLKKKFSHRVGNSRKDASSNSADKQSPLDQADFTSSFIPKTSASLISNQRILEGGVIKESVDFKHFANAIFADPEIHGAEAPGKESQYIGLLKDGLSRKQIDVINEISLRREGELILKQQTEFMQLNRQVEEEKMKLKKKNDLDLNHVHALHTDSSSRNSKVNLLNKVFSETMERFDQHMKCQFRKLAARQIGAMLKERQIKHHWLIEAKAGGLAESFDKIPLSESGFRLEEFKFCKGVSSIGLGSVKFAPGSDSDSGLALEDQCINLIPECSLGLAELRVRSAESFAVISDRMGPALLETGRLASQPKSADLHQCAVSVEEYTEIQDTVPHGRAHTTMVTETPVPEPFAIHSPSSELDQLPNEPTLGEVVSNGCSGGADNSNSPCVMSSAQNYEGIPALTEQMGPSGENSASSDQVPSAEVDQRPVLSTGVENDQNISLQESMAPAAVVVPPDLQQACQDSVVTDQLFLQSMASTVPHNQGDPSGSHVQPGIEGHLFQSVIGQWLPPQAIHPDPFQNELIRIRKHEDLFTKTIDDKKLQLKEECEQEIEKIRVKYEKLIQDADVEYLHGKESFSSIYDKVLLNKILAEEFRSRFIIENKGAASAALQGACPSFMQQFHQVSQSLLPQRPSAALQPTIISSTPASLPQMPVPSALVLARPLSPSPAYISVPSNQMRHTSAVLPSTPVRPHFSLILPPHLQSGGEPRAPASRAPAPHLHLSRPPMPLPVVQTHLMNNQQQNVTNAGSLSHPTLQVPSLISHKYPSSVLVGRITSLDSRDSNHAATSLYQPPAHRSESEGELAVKSQTGIQLVSLRSMDVTRTASSNGAVDVVCIDDD